MRLWPLLLALPCLAATACTAEPDVGAAEDDIVPASPQDLFEQARMCNNSLRARAGFRDVDLAEGVLRWNCGDVNGVTGPDLGQEYCEFHAVHNGVVVDNKAAKPKSDEAVECVFTSFYSDVKGWDRERKTWSRETKSFAEGIASQMAPQLRKASSLEPFTAVMRGQFNSRGAASVLVDDCAGVAREPQIDADRQAACVVKWLATSDASARADLEKACRGVDLSIDKNFARAEKLGVAVDPNSDQQRDIAACTLLMHAPNGGVGWRNSDPAICARAARGARCGYEFAEIPDAVNGFDLMGWTQRDALPVGCRYLELDEGSGTKKSTHVVVCEASKADVDAYNQSKKPLQMLCRDKFGVNLAMQAPLRAIAKKNERAKVTDTAEFCSAFAGSEAK